MKWTTGHRVDFFADGESYFDRLEQEIARAQKEIVFEVYIFRDDAIGRRMADALIDAAKRGVHISLVVDGVGSMDTPFSFFETMLKAGIQICIFQVFRRWPLLNGFQIRRLHRKVVVIDERLAFVGGINIADDQIQSDEKPAKLDTALLIEGPIVRRIHHASKRFFLRLTGRWVEWFKLEQRYYLKSPSRSFGDVKAMYAIRDNFGHRRKLERYYLKAIDEAQDEILITSAYFVPHLRLRRSLIRAAKRGVKITVFIQGKTDAPVAYHAARPLYHSLIRHGIDLVECVTRVLHSKAAVIDGEWATVGSFNWEPFSVFLNIEGNVFLKDREVAKQIYTSLDSWKTQYGQSLTLKDLELTFLQSLQILLARAAYWLASLLGRTKFD